eukprot:TRINITY_DN15430_c0_g1_i1.p1 TRINITY_DN15430_c0_g1~~TRINITY_DN15430_c0_g1_i1.p1  ORF type:complete len:152 (+),score=14.88 TRINITY_DN15430_c0_g1_i1:101-556(+)
MDYAQNEMKQIHARYDDNKLYQAKVGRLSADIWKQQNEDGGDVNLEHGPKKMLKRDGSWVRLRAPSNHHAQHSSVGQLRLSGLVSRAKIFEQMTPTENGSAIDPKILRKRSGKLVRFNGNNNNNNKQQTKSSKIISYKRLILNEIVICNFL